MPPEPAITIRNMTKRYPVPRSFRDILFLRFRGRRYVQSLTNVNLDIPRGGVFGLLGPNGAGKTTLFKILGTLVLPTSGEVRVLDIDVAKEPDLAKQVLTYVVTEERSLFWRLSARQNLRYFAALQHMPRKQAERRINELLALMELEEAADRRVLSYSTGMKQKVALARGLLTEPEILLLDEPTRSLDPIVSRNLWMFIRQELVEKLGKTVVLATHNLDEARRECDTLAVLRKGEIVATGSAAELSAQLTRTTPYTLTVLPPRNGVVSLLHSVQGVHVVKETTSLTDERRTLEVEVEDPDVQIPVILQRATERGVKIVACAPRERPLTDVLAQLAGGTDQR